MENDAQAFCPRGIVESVVRQRRIFRDDAGKGRQPFPVPGEVVGRFSQTCVSPEWRGHVQPHDEEKVRLARKGLDASAAMLACF